jgi:hypothetical protein
MPSSEKQTNKELALKMAAARLLLGDDLALRVIEDRWNAINELSDPCEKEDGTARVSLDAVEISIAVLRKITRAMDEPIKDLSNRRVKALAEAPVEEIDAWYKGEGPEPAILAAQKPEPLREDPRLLLRELLSQTAPEGEFRMGSPEITVICNDRADGSAWISVGDVSQGPHFQCDYYGCLETGPKHISDFAYEPPQWVIDRLGLT